MSGLRDATAVVGIGHTEYSKDSGRSELRLATEAVSAALADAGLEASEVDGLVTYTRDLVQETDLARAVGMGDLTFFSRIGYGGGAACAVVQQAAMAVATGAARTVVVYRALNGRSGKRYGAGRRTGAEGSDGFESVVTWVSPSGLSTPAGWIALFARRYMHEFGATSEDFGRLSVLMRRHASTNPDAWYFGRPITLEEHQASPWIVEPLRRLDCCQESDGAVALVVTSAERARDLATAPALIRAAAQGSGNDQHMMTSYYRAAPELAELPEVALVARQLFGAAGLAPADIDVAMLYDHFTPFVLPQLESFGFCDRGEARHLVAEGRLDLDGELPLNPHGGQLGEAYMHGVNGVVEAVRQIRGTAANQVSGAANVLVTAGTGVPTSGLILSSDQ